MLTRQNMLRLLLPGRLLAALVVPVVGMGIANRVAGALDGVDVDAILIRGDGPAGQPAAGSFTTPANLCSENHPSV